MADVSTYPRVLVVGAEPFGHTTGTGITLSNLFGGWPTDRLAQVHLTARAPSTDVCQHYFPLDPRSAPVDYWTRRFVAKGAPGGPPAPAANPAARSAGGRMWQHMRAVADLSPLVLPRQLLRWTRRYRPEVVYSVLGSVRVMRLACGIARHCGVPLVPHFMDDWPTTLYADGELLGLGRRAKEANLREVVRLSRSGLCISTPMADEYRRRYRIPFAAFMNCVDGAAFAGYRAGARPPDPRSAEGGVEFVYAGGLHLGRWASLARIGAALERIVSPLPPARLTVYAPERDLEHYASAFADLPAVRLARSVGSTEVLSILRSADVLVHVESFAPELVRYTRLSLSTKIPQYLAAGRPILGHGPGELASMRHIVTADAGLVVGEEKVEPLVRRIEQLCGDPLLRQRFGDNGYSYAKVRHSRQEVASAFVAQLAQVAGTAREGAR
ncbi:glycosyl transferase family 1 [Micromonospora peucetia]|uniref:Glycosyl transferase family 1 n=1 Tax=Micromonospora peucetia TaxID=47871 RepID=A0A1C6W5Y0_9ACTN|nr:glycosyl transferase family 1 [Micromonospora peucetia]MCX4385593.1 glycosyl transferase family 1 [Micromonospora peucetia]WSA32977.1 glycosyl transferase family 1 [Micromonospora peucetia]SCL73989.1 Glycosyltransferase involved in cell wall bisynthesis [Micromonospora peucetia]